MLIPYTSYCVCILQIAACKCSFLTHLTVCVYYRLLPVSVHFLHILLPVCVCCRSLPVSLQTSTTSTPTSNASCCMSMLNDMERHLMNFDFASKADDLEMCFIYSVSSKDGNIRNVSSVLLSLHPCQMTVCVHVCVCERERERALFYLGVCIEIALSICMWVPALPRRCLLNCSMFCNQLWSDGASSWARMSTCLQDQVDSVSECLFNQNITAAAIFPDLTLLMEPNNLMIDHSSP